MKSFIYSVTIGTAMGLAIITPLKIARCMSDHAAVRNAKETKERTRLYIHRAMDDLNAKHNGEPFEDWPEIDRFAYDAMKRGLREIGD